MMDKEFCDYIMAMYLDLYDEIDELYEKVKEVRKGFEAMENDDYIVGLKKAEEKLSTARWDVC